MALNQEVTDGNAVTTPRINLCSLSLFDDYAPLFIRFQTLCNPLNTFRIKQLPLLK